MPLWDESMRTYQWVEHKIRSLARKPSDKDIDATAQQERRGCLKRGVDGNWKPFERLLVLISISDGRFQIGKASAILG